MTIQESAETIVKELYDLRGKKASDSGETAQAVVVWVATVIQDAVKSAFYKAADGVKAVESAEKKDVQKAR
jgi:hypothetical protein